jgi:hypothetical protein
MFPADDPGRTCETGIDRLMTARDCAEWRAWGWLDLTRKPCSRIGNGEAGRRTVGLSVVENPAAHPWRRSWAEPGDATLIATPRHPARRGDLKPGMTLGATNELGSHTTESRPMSTASRRPCPTKRAFDHPGLTFRGQERDFKLADVAGKVIQSILT